MKNPLPPNPWFYAQLILPVVGVSCATTDGVGVIPAKTLVAVRQSREGGWRIMSKTCQATVADVAASKTFRLRLNGQNVAVSLADQDKANAHLAEIFKNIPRKSKTAKPSKAAA